MRKHRGITKDTTRTSVREPRAGGDADAGGEVTIEELITLVNMALGNQPQLSAYPHGIPADVTDISQVDIALIIRAVNNALNGCSPV